MTISNALPIQFWEINALTFNEQDICAKTSVCFCEYIKAGEQSIQVYNPGNSPTLKAYNSSGAEIDIDPSTSGAVAGIYTISFTIPQTAIGQEIQLIVLDTTGTIQRMKTGCLQVVSVVGNDVVQGITSANDDPTPGPDGTRWTTGGDGDAGWSDNGGSAEVTLGNGDVSDHLAYTFPISLPVGTYRLTYRGEISSGVPLGAQAEFYLVSGSEAAYTKVFAFADMPFDLTEIVTVSSPITGLSIWVDNISSLGDVTYLMELFNIERVAGVGNCVSLIRYSNHKNYMGIDYESGSPAPEYEIIVPAMFFEESYPLEEEVHPLSNDTWKRTWSRMEGKKLLELGFLPYYMHRKLQFILVHDEIEIDGVFWVKRDPYEIAQGNKRYPLKRGQVVLTERDFISRNLI